MDQNRWNAARGASLNAPGDRLGISFGAAGPSIGPVALLQKVDGALTVRPIEELEYVLGLAFDKSIDFSRYVPALTGVARALNVGDLGQAMLRVQLMGLPVLADEDAFQRAVEAEDLWKAAPDDPKHPGYPKGTPNGRGGQFRPKDVLAGEEVAEKAVEKRLERLIVRRAFRAGLRRIVTARAALRFAGEAVSNVVPVADAVGDVMMAEQAGEVLAEGYEIREEADAALNFVKKGPWDLEDLYASKKPESFNSFDEFKKMSDVGYDDLEKIFGKAKPGYEYHHIVEQGASGRTFSPRELNSTTNIVEIQKLVHEILTSESASTAEYGGVRQTLRSSLNGKSFAEQQSEGIELMRRVGIIK